MHAVLGLIVAAAALASAAVPRLAPEFLTAGDEDHGAFQDALARTLADIRAMEAAAQESRDPRLDEDAVLKTPELIAKYGYPSESHDIVTEDGYILTFHRIPHGRGAASRAPNSRPLLLMHGMGSSSDDWIVTGPENGLGYILADAGYDVWMGNARGNKWSRRHATLSPDDIEFWDISWHEIGVYDLPAAIDYILDATGLDKLHYVGYSMGGTSFTVMGAEQPEYNNKIHVAALMAPAVFFVNYHEQPLSYLSKYTRQVWALSKLLGVGDILKPHMLYTVAGDRLCHDDDPLQALCIVAAGLVGINTEQLNATILPVYLGHWPAGSAVKNYMHYGQSINSGKFQQFDYGTVQNQIKYGSASPPEYDLSKLTAPVSIHYAQNDGTVMAEDVLYLAEQLPNTIGMYLVPKEKFNHADFAIAMQVKELVYNDLVDQLNEY